MSRRWHPPRPSRKRVVLTLAALILLPTLAFSLLLGTSPGARFVLHQVLTRLPIEVTVDDISGRLWGPLRLQGIHIEAPAAVVQIGTVELDWAPARLFSRTLRVERFIVEDVQGHLVSNAPRSEAPAKDPDAPPAGLPQIPVKIIIEEARISRVSMLLAEDLRLADLQFSMSGTPDDYSIDFATRLEGDAFPPTAVQLRAAGGLSSARLDSLRVQTLEGEVVAVADVTWYPELTWKADIVAERLQPGLLAAAPEEWPGQVGARLHTEGSMQGGLPTGTAVIDTIAGDVRGQTVTGSGEASFSGAERVGGTFDFVWSSVQVQLQGELTDSLIADVQLACGDLGELLPEAEGNVALEVAVRGLRSTPRGTAELRVGGLSLPANGIRLSSAEAHLEVDSSRDLLGRVQVTLDTLYAGTNSIDRSTLLVEGDRHAQTLRLDAAGSGLELLLAMQGVADADSLRWTGTVDTLNATHPLVGPWALAETAHWTASKSFASLDSLRLKQGAASLGLSGEWKLGSWSAHGSLAEIPLSLAGAQLPEDRWLRGAANLDFAAEAAADGQLRAELAATLDDARFVYPSRDALDSLLLEDARIVASVADSGATATVSLVVATADAPARMSLVGELALPGLNSIHVDLQSQPLQASVRGDLPDLGVFNDTTELVQSLAGAIVLQLDATGTLAAPEVNGVVDATGIQVAMPDLGLNIHDAELHARNEAGQGFSLTGSAVSGEGRLDITGSLPQHPSAETPATASVVGERFEGMNTSEVELLLSPDLQLQFDGSRMDITGTMAIPRLQIELVEVPEAAVPVSRDVVIVEEEAEAGAPPIDTWVDIELVLGDEVRFRGLGADMELTGQLGIQQHLPNPPQARGDIRITKGSYQAYGQDLNFERGVLSFVGPPENPNLDMRAARTAADGTVAGLLITGTAEEPVLTIYSEPTMTDTDAISYLLTGRPMDAGTGDDRARVGGAAALLGSNMISNKLGSKVGLDEARVESEGDIEDSALVAGKYITPDLYLSYAMGLFDRSNLVRLRYTLTPRWAVQTETGTTQGADILYNIEFGGH